MHLDFPEPSDDQPRAARGLTRALARAMTLARMAVTALMRKPRTAFASAALAMAALVVGVVLAAPGTYVVDSNGDAPDATPGDGICATAGGVCTLRAAIQEANATSGAKNINFNLPSCPGAGCVITPSSGLPVATATLNIDGRTQPSWVSAPIVELNGASAGTVTGLQLQGTGSSLRGLVVRNFGAHGVTLSLGTGMLVQSNYIGTNAAGSAAASNSTHGVVVFTTGNSIGGVAAGQGNVISGNAFDGIVIRSSGNSVQGNFIGTNAAGTAALGNSRYGINLFTAAASNNTVGGNTAAARNLISGNLNGGVIIQGAGNSLQGNYIGTNAAGTAAVGNNYWGIRNVASDTAIGGAGAGEGNVISGNGVNTTLETTGGVVVEGALSGVTVAGNTIGLAANGLTGLPNGKNGVFITGGASVTVGGPSAAHRNIISSNYSHGVASNTNGSGVITVQNNYIGLAVDGNTARGNGVSGAGDGIAFWAGSNNGLILNNVIASSSRHNINLLSGAVGNVVRGNLVGLNAAGTAARGAGIQGMVVDGNTNNTIGGPAPADRNVISGNAQHGLMLAGGSGHTVQGNYLGTNAAGTAALPNGEDGITCNGNGSGHTIGGTSAGMGNLVSGNGRWGISIYTCSGVSLQGNTVGRSAANTTNVENGSDGIAINDSTSITVGGSGSAAANTVAGNGRSGIYVSGNSNANAIRGNSVFGNRGIGIDLTGGPVFSGADGVTANDGITTTGAPNIFMDSPVITGATLSGSTLTVAGYVGSAPSQATFANSRVEVFVSDGSASSYGQGQTYLGFLTSDASGNFAGSLAVPSGVTVLRGVTKLTGTATDTANNTSEFGANFLVAATNISGTIYEDVHYGGGGGRGLGTSLGDGGSARAGATVELYSVNGGVGTWLQTTTTNAGGSYNFTATGGSDFAVRVVNASVTSARSGYSAALLPVLTSRSEWNNNAAWQVADHVGGKLPSATDAPAASSGATFDVGNGLFTAGVSGTAQAYSVVTVGTTSPVGVDFGFNFNTVVNTNDSGAGSLRQAITNTEALGGDAALAQAGRPAGIDNLVFMISNGSSGAGGSLGLAAGGLRGGLNYFTTNGADAMVATLNLASALPGIGNPLVLDAQTQPGWSSANPRPIVEMNGAFSSGDYYLHGFVIYSSNSAVRGFVINRFGGRGIVVGGASGVVVQGNWVGLNPAGTGGSGNGVHGISSAGVNGLFGGTTPAQRNAISGNGGIGIVFEGDANTAGNRVIGNWIGLNGAGTSAAGNAVGAAVAYGGANNFIGGTAAGEGNVISGNSFDGVYLISNAGTGNQVLGNRIGTNVAGTAILANGENGVRLNAPGTVVGGDAVGAGNLISGNTLSGIAINASDATIQGNTIGLNAAGTAKLPNAQHGITLSAGGNIQIGGTSAAARNVISGNGGAGNGWRGIAVFNIGGPVLIQGNYIGTNSAGTAALGNQADGVWGASAVTAQITVGGSAPGAGNLISGNGWTGIGFDNANSVIQGNLIGTDAAGTAALPNTSVGVYLNGTNHRVGGTGAGEGNTIRNNAHGVSVVGVNQGTAILGNSISANVGLGIDLVGNAAIEPNDGAKTAGAANLLMDSPVFTIASLNGTNLTVAGYVGSAANQATFANSRVEVFVSDANASGNGQGRTYLGFLTSDSNGNFSGTVTVPSGTAVARVTGTATDTANNTSEFGANAFVSMPLTGRVVEDMNYGGGPGRSSAVAISAGGTARSGAVVELYSVSGSVATHVQSTTTDGSGDYSFMATGLNFAVRVVGASVPSARTGYSASLLPVLTSRADWTANAAVAITDFVGGTNPAATDAPAASTGATFNTSTGVFSAGVSGTAQAFSLVSMAGIAPSGVDFAFNFNTVVNTNDSGAGSLRQAITNANALTGEASLAQQGRTAGVEHLVFMISNGSTGAGGSLGLAAGGLRSGVNYFLTNGGSANVATISPLTVLPYVSTLMVIDARAQPGWTNRPVLEISGASTAPSSFGLGASSSAFVTHGSAAAGRLIAGFVVNRWAGRGFEVTAPVNIMGNWIGLSATGALLAGSMVDGIFIYGSSNVLIGSGAAADGNVIAGASQTGVWAYPSPGTGPVIKGNKVGTNADGNTALGVAVGLHLSTPNAVIGGVAVGEGNQIAGSSSYGLLLDSTGATVLGNRIGTSATGAVALPNVTGIVIRTANNTVGGSAAGEGNLISGNSAQGILMNAVGATGNTVQGNTIGLNAAGTAALRNGTDASGASDHGGVVITAGSGNLIGGSAAGQGNVISGNAFGVMFRGAAVTSNRVEGNRIGTNAAGTAAVGNDRIGVAIDNNASSNVIGGAATGSGNQISGNPSVGIYVATGGAAGTVVQGNRIGTLADGVTAMAGTFHSDGAVYLTLGLSQTTITDNTITASAGGGVVVVGGDRASIRFNRIYGNTGLGIDLGSNGVTPNDGAKTAGQPNQSMDMPVLTTAVLGSNTVSVVGYVGSAALQSTFGGALVDVYVSSNHASGYGEGKAFIGTLTANADGEFAGTLSTASISGLNAGSTRITATATDVLGNTSEFSANRLTTALAAFQNGGFESTSNPPPAGYFVLNQTGSTVMNGWVVTGVDIEHAQTTFSEPEGTRSLDLSGSTRGGVAQVFQTVAGQTYTVTFDHAGNTYAPCGPRVKALRASVNGNASNFTFDTTGKANNALVWATRSISFTASSEASVVWFESLDPSCAGPVLDNVRLTLGAPAPAGISGTVFEDVNYGGGSGRSLLASSGAVRSGARVELFDAAGAFVTSTTTNASGVYAFASLSLGNYTVRVVGSSVSSSRTGWVNTLTPTLTFKTDATGSTAVADLNAVGGANPLLDEAGNAGGASPTLAALTTASATAQAIASVQLAGDITGVDFGFNFSSVVNARDSGQGSLRQAITNANALGGDAALLQVGRTAGIENLIFMLPNGSSAAGLRSGFNAFTTTAGARNVATIQAITALPFITQPLIANAQTQPGWVDAPLIELRGDGVGGSASGLVVNASNTQIRGFVINRFSVNSVKVVGALSNALVAGNWVGVDATGLLPAAAVGQADIIISGGSGHWVGGGTAAERNVVSTLIELNTAAFSSVVAGNYVGTNATGSAALGTSGYARVSMNSAGSGNRIGGPNVGERNVLSGGTDHCVKVITTPTVVIQGNYIGLGADGSSALGSCNYGVLVWVDAPNAQIGGANAGEGNVIVGAARRGMDISGVNAVIQGNKVGWNPNTNAAMANVTGVMVDGAGALVGGTSVGARNILSGNSFGGLYLSGGATGAVVQGNYVGLAADGITAIPNDGFGVIARAPGGLFGGTAAGAGNVISSNLGAGLSLDGDASGSVVQGNLIGLAADGVIVRGNAASALVLQCSTSCTVGGTSAAARNVISASTGGHGIDLQGSNNVVQGNYIGTDASGTLARGSSIYDGIYVTGSNLTIGGTAAGAGNVISGNGRHGLNIAGAASGLTVAGNLIGTNAAGTAALANAQNGVLIGAPDITIGGTATGSRNLISGNGLGGVSVQANGAVVQGNYIGVNATGTAAVANGTAGASNGGVWISASINNSLIGGTTAAARNVISGNGGAGVWIGAGNAHTVHGNYIGTNAAGNAGISNGRWGMVVAGTGQQIGGTAAGAGNLISGNTSSGGIFMQGAAHVVEGNSIGLNATGSGYVPNGSVAGIEIRSGSGNRIGGTALGAGNTIAGNTGVGVAVNGTGSGHLMLGNRIYANSGIGIDVGGGNLGASLGVTANDGIKTTGAPNLYTDHPVFTTASVIGKRLIVAGYVGTAPGQAVFANSRVEVFKSDLDASSYGEGRDYLGFVTTDASGNFSGEVTVPAAVVLVAGDKLTGTATDTGNNTSEFGLNRTVDAGIGGRVFEDVNYGGGAGRPWALAQPLGAAPTVGARVELYNNLGGFVTSTVTAADGTYALPTTGTGSFTVRVVNTGLLSTRSGSVSGLWPVMTYRAATDGSGNAVTVANEVGGAVPNAQDVAPNTTNATWSSLSVSAVAQPMSYSAVTTPSSGGGIDNIDFGFNFSAVVNTNDAGQGSLRQAILNANTLGGDAALAQTGRPAAIENLVFMISNGTSGAGGSLSLSAGGLRSGLNYFNTSAGSYSVATVALTSSDNIDWSLHATTPMVVDAQTQPGWTLNPIIEINGAGAGTVRTALMLNAGGSTVRGLVINRATSHGLFVYGNGNTLQGCWLGLNAAGTTAQGNADDGLVMDGTASLIGGTTPQTRVVASGNGRFGVHFYQGHGAAGGNTLLGSHVGLNAAGNAAVANANAGVYVSTANNTVGDGTAAGRNLISGNGLLGLSVNASGTLIQGNWIGTDATGSAALGNGNYGMVIASASNTVGGAVAGQGNLISGNGIDGVVIQSANNIVQGNLIGTDGTGATPVGNGRNGVHLYTAAASNNLIGGTTAATRNVISGNGDSGVFVSGINNTISGNYLGTNAAGTASLGTQAFGVQAVASSSGTMVGGTAAGAGNVISGNLNGVQFIGNGDLASSVLGNIIGLNAAGTAAVPNTGFGIALQNLPTNITIGGPAVVAGTGAGNVVSGNGGGGVFLSGYNHRVQGNNIGLNAARTAAIGNLSVSGVWSVIGSGSVVGGTAVGEGNVIAGNTGPGVMLDPMFGGNVQTAVLGNSIYGNGGVGIDLKNSGANAVAEGVTPNDGVKTPGRVNSLMDSPVFTLATSRGNQLTVAGFVGTAAGQSVFAYSRVEMYVADADATGYGEGKTYLGALTTDASGNFAGTVTLPVASLSQGMKLTATATDNNGAINGNTSEFGINFAGLVVDFVVNSNLDEADANPGDGICATVSGVCSLRAAITEMNAWPTLASTPSVVFALPNCPGAGCVITPASALPALSRAMVIDGLTQPGWALGATTCTPMVDVRGESAGSVSGFNLNAAGSTLRGVAVGGFMQSGVSIAANTVTVECVFAGVNVDGVTARANGPADSATGGVYVQSGTGIVIGGSTLIQRNVLSGNGGAGLWLVNGSISVYGNHVGTNATGTAALGNQRWGVHLSAGSNIAIGGPLAGQGNLISGNTGGSAGGLLLSAVAGATVQGNTIGLNAAGTSAIPNGNAANGYASGIDARGGSDVLIGGTNPGEGNVIAGNQGHGVRVTSQGFRILGNSIYNNLWLGIDLGANGVTANNGTLSNALPNKDMDHPVITSAGYDSASRALTVTGYIGTGTGQAAFTGARVELFSAELDATGYGEGRDFLGYLVADANGRFSGTVSVPAALTGFSIGSALTATATESASLATGNTSEFGPNYVTTSVSALVPRGFNAFETSTAAGAVTGVLQTRVAGAASNVAVVAIDTNGTSLKTAFTGSVSLEWMNASNNTGLLDANNCRASWTSAGGAGSAVFAGADAGRKTAAVTPTTAGREWRLRMTYAGGSGTVVSCSTDAFAVRPATLDIIAVTDGTDTTAGLMRALDTLTVSGGRVHRAGRPFSMRAAARDSASAVAAGYDGAPTLAITGCVLPAGCSAGTLTAPALSASAGLIAVDSLSYSEVGAISVQLTDDSFADIDTADTPLAQRRIQSAAVGVGRFVPDRYVLAATNTPQFATQQNTCAAAGQGYTYVGQNFGWATAPRFSITAQNAAGGSTVLWAGALQKINPATHLTRLLAASNAEGLVPAATWGGMTLTDAGGGVANVSLSGDQFLFSRNVNTPVASFNPAITLNVALSDSSELGVGGNTAVPSVTDLLMGAGAGIAFDQASNFHYGRLKLQSAFGDARRGVQANLELQKFSPRGWVRLSEDNTCTSLPASAVAFNSGVGAFSTDACAAPASAAVVMRQGRGTLSLPKTAGNLQGATTVTLNIGAALEGNACAAGVPVSPLSAALPHLLGARGLATTQNQNPSARLTWGRQHREYMSVRELY